MQFPMTEEEVLEHVDEYTLYCHYLEFEPEIKCNYSSPLRADDQSPSFGIFSSHKSDREYFWKDSGGKGASGDIFKLVQLLYGYESRWEALNKVKGDFGLGDLIPGTPKIIRSKPIIREFADIRLRPRDFRPEELTWWNQFNISSDLLSFYRTSAIYWYKMSPQQYAPFFPSSYSFVYRVYDRYQLYFPFQPKGMKFRNDLMDHHVMGVQQLNYQSDTLIITKSYKDVMCLRSYGYEAVSPRSENVPMPEGFFTWADKHYRNKVVLFDNDMKHRGDWYPYQKIYVPEEPGVKDISDFTKAHGPADAAELLRSIVSI